MLSVGANSICGYPCFLRGKYQRNFPKDRDVAGGHMGCQVYIAQSSSKFSFRYCVPKASVCFDVRGSDSETDRLTNERAVLQEPSPGLCIILGFTSFSLYLQDYQA